jgi:hypothetical protein
MKKNPFFTGEYIAVVGDVVNKTRVVSLNYLIIA